MAERLTPRKQQALEMRSRIQNVALDLFDRVLTMKGGQLHE